jgi:DNA-binding MarR family transcriptional regulator
MAMGEGSELAPGAGETAFATEAIAARVVTGLAKIGLAARHRAWVEGQGLSPAQGQILSLLRARDPDGMRLTEIAEAMAVSAPTATVAVQALERKGLVQKVRVGSDGRARAVTLTDDGRREAHRAAGWSDFLLSAVETLTPAEQDVFYRGLVKMIVTLQQRGEIPVSRMCATCRFFRPHAHPGSEHPHHCAFVDAPFGDRALRLDCADHEAASPEKALEAGRSLLSSG